MDIVIGRLTHQFDVEKENVETLFEIINQILDENGWLFDEVVMDGEKVSDNIESIISENFKTITRLEVSYTEKIEYIINTWKITKAYIGEVLPQLHNLAVAFYTVESNDIWEKIISLFDVVDQLLQSHSQLDSLINSGIKIKDPQLWTEYSKTVTNINQSLLSLQNAMECHDTVYIGDLIKWEFYKNLRKMEDTLVILLNEEALC
jgi:hypothetical protein